MDARFLRTEMLVGSDGLQKLKDARVAVCGLGSFGSYDMEALVRSGVGHLRIIDFDSVEFSNINRQLFALESTLGRKKIEIATERILDINPECKVEALDFFVDEQTLPMVLEKPLDYVIDAIDSLGPKVNLIMACLKAGVPLISSMGAATRVDPSAVKIGDLFQATYCPLARRIRKRLRKRGIYKGVPCVYSTEAPFVPDDEELRFEKESYFRGRPRVPLGSFSFLTGIFGLMAAGEVVKSIIGLSSKR